MTAAIVRLSTGHVFARGSVVAIGPLSEPRAQWKEVDGCVVQFDVVGVGFVVPAITVVIRRISDELEDFTGPIERYEDYLVRLSRLGETIRQEFIDRLLGPEL